MTWADFYLFCFAFGFIFSLVAAVTGHLHMDFGHGHGGHGGHFGHGGHGDLPAHGTAGEHQVSPLNMGTVAAFLAWFGGTGYLATRYYGIGLVVGLGASAAAGAVGAYAVYCFLAKVLMREREEMNPADYDMIGVLGQVSSPIRASGFGEILFSRDGARRCAAARSENGSAIPNGVDVVVTRYQDGIAYVRRWDDLA